MRMLLAGLLCLSLAAHAEEQSPEPFLVAAGSVVAMKLATKIDGCKEDPCNSAAHIAAGAALGAYIKQKHGPRVAFYTVLAIGVGKEMLDQNFDPKDALMTGLGGLLSVSYEF